MTTLAAVTEFCALKDPYRVTRNSKRLFDRAMREMVAFHYAHTPGYARWLAAHDLSFESARSITDWSRLPPLFARYFKQHLVLSHTGHEALELTSSGTTGQVSRMRYDARSIAAVQSMVVRIFQHYGWSAPRKRSNYLILNYEPTNSMRHGAAYTDEFLRRFSTARHIDYALRHDGDDYRFDVFGATRALQKFACDGYPVRIMGFPALLWFILEHMRKTDCSPLNLADDSLVFLGGGWKTYADFEVPKATLYQRISDQLGIPADRCRDGYGALEHPVPYVECANHRFHVPVYARVYIRDTRTFECLPYGRRGFFHAASPFITSSPAHSIVMSDLATLHPAQSCSCGLEAEWFELHGRAGTHVARNCAFAASEFLPRH
ncbi:acyl-protein synthase [Burkholderia stagnalis]|uniref:LuxE/PaaK family acyltransferase n=1 Tax=Burkholderia stagnalis TaxID=1503054 RepID=UPI0009BF57F9|nr:acyl-protein synthase [Burkholderia stagnalis]MDY7806665.1 acyl-protein synthase [Burkholderia stagnalis]